MEVSKREKKHKEKRRSNEKRKERSRDAARCRRSRETDIFTELAAALPVSQDQATHLDKASVMRLAIAYLKVRAVVDSIPGTITKTETSVKMDELFPEALNGFMLVLSNDGNMVYLSENVSEYLGVSQMDMMGQSVYEYSHPCDHDELRECLSSKPIEDNDKRSCSFFLRLKCTLTSKGRKVNLKSASYKVIHCIGRLTNIHDSNSNSVNVEKEKDASSDKDEIERETGPSLILVGCPIPHPSNIEIPLGRQTFLSKYSLSMKFTYADEKLAEYLGWDSEELMGQSVFEFHHALDNLALDKSFKSLFSKGQCETVAYRFLGKKGGYAWVVTQATLIHCSKQHKPLSVVCVNYILSGVECEDEVYSVRQLVARDSEKTVKSEPLQKIVIVETPPLESATLEVSPKPEILQNVENVVAPIVPLQEQNRNDRPQAVTASIFRPAASLSNQETKKESDKIFEGNSRKPTVSGKSSFPVQAPKKILEEVALKENDQPKKRRQSGRTEFIFQGKPALEYDFEAALRRDRPQAVTRQLFVPLSSTTNQQQQSQQQQELQQQVSYRPPPQTATASIFAPRTEDMNKGFLTFSEDQPGLTMLKDEPEDLTHLAPTPGDVCVPLEDTPFLSDMLDEFILGNDSYYPLLSPGVPLSSELRGTDLGETLKDTDLGDSTRNKCLGDSLADSDPFMYGDSPASPCSIDPNSVSPSLSKYRQSPERSVDSLGSPTGGSAGEGFSEDEMLMLGISDNTVDDELALRAPYIPMSDQDEALDLLISNDMVMWGASQSVEKSSKWLVEDRDQRDVDSSLAQLLRTDQAVARRYNDHGGGLVNPVQVLGQIPRKNLFNEQNRWSTKINNDRASKRLHTPSNDLENGNKRIKCEDPLSLELSKSLENQRLMFDDQGKSRSRSNNLSGSQLLRRLVSQQTFSRTNRTNVESSCNGLGKNNRRRTCEEEQRIRNINDNNNHSNSNNNKAIKDDDEDEAEGDSGGGGDQKRRCLAREILDNATTVQSSTNSHRNPPYNSVLMNLLVSGCDDTATNSRNVPTLGNKNLTSPLSVNVDNQMVPQCPDGLSNISLDRLSPSTRKHLVGSLSGGSMASPSTGIISFDQLEYDVVCTGPGLLQMDTGLHEGPMDRNLV
ncbi:endothelial PAS domain-containing protein 1 isoform X2 [Vespula pensylvanica]|uniref:endothelial PAS domain-containing protein 1 isoform X2 n=1 Tax=Vespula pensylvanica TaxID=30213 RepID=UPI001CBA572D|nr:endothelial PAS domain-containing protein 1 isoform X2 [Vespula pensylvanica]XP_050847606.1 endothelial PAS domain-containing protein 1 isoform X2 [Vespula vulgaris]